MGVADGRLERRASHTGEPPQERLEVEPLRRAQRELDPARRLFAIDRKTGGVRPAVAERSKHAGEERAQLGLEPLIFEKQADNAAHDFPQSSWPGQEPCCARAAGPRRTGMTAER